MKDINYNEKIIDLEEQKEILLQILKYIDDICRKNDIKYTLVGGSLIGAIRHKGIIPWDDDIDIGLLPDEYDKLINCLKNDNKSYYKLLDLNSESTYWYPFAKLVDTRTICNEIYTKKIKNYGIYVDIFKYNYIPDEKNKIDIYYSTLRKKCGLLFKTITINHKNIFKKAIYKIVGKMFPIGVSRKIAKSYVNYSEQYNDLSMPEYVMLNWTPYGAEKETLKKAYFDDYIDVEFDGIRTMVVKRYDEVLSHVFGDYMTPPPIEKQITHHDTKIYWK